MGRFAIVAVARTWSHEEAGLVLLERVRDPADRAAEREERRRTLARQTERARDRHEPDVDRWTPESAILHRIDQREHRLDLRRIAPQPPREIDEHVAPRIRVGRVDRMREALDHLAAALPVVDDLLDPLRRSGLDEQRVDAVRRPPCRGPESAASAAETQP